MVNIERPDFDEPREQDGFRAQRARISRQPGAERLGLSLCAHQIVNRTDETLRFLAFSPNGGLRVWFRQEDEAEYYDGESAPG